MTSIVSAISGHFSRGLVFGTLMPVLTFTVIGGLVLGSWLPRIPGSVNSLQQLGPEWQAAAFVLVTVVLTGLLWNCNVPLTRLYEGYSWEKSWMGKKRASRYRAECEAWLARWTGFRTLQYALNDWSPVTAGIVASTEAQRDAINAGMSDIGRDLHLRYPLPPDLVLPTRLGNVIRSFETYPQQQYEMSAIPLWPRLIAVIDKDYATAIEDQRTSFDFMLNCSALCAMCAALLLVFGLAVPLPFARASWLLLWIVEIIAFVSASFLFYEGAIGRAAAWGDTVRGAFDLYRHALLEKLGYTTIPATLADERRVWRTISQQIIFGDTRRIKTPPLKSSSTTAIVEPRWLQVDLHRSVGVPDATTNVQRVYLTVKNDDPSGAAAQKVVIRDELPSNVEFMHGSVTTGVAVTGVNPVQFTVAGLAAGTAVDIEFNIVRHKA